MNLLKEAGRRLDGPPLEDGIKKTTELIMEYIQPILMALKVKVKAHQVI
jgi:predicted metal-binding protein